MAGDPPEDITRPTANTAHSHLEDKIRTLEVYIRDMSKANRDLMDERDKRYDERATAQKEAVDRLAKDNEDKFRGFPQQYATSAEVRANNGSFDTTLRTLKERLDKAEGRSLAINLFFAAIASGGVLYGIIKGG